MVSFDKLYNEFQKTNNVCDFCDKYSDDDTSTRFLLIRSLDKEHLVDIVTAHTYITPSNKIKDLMEQAYESTVTIQYLISYIESKRADLIKSREQELNGLEAVLSQIPVVNCGVRNDKVDDIVKSFVRNKTIKSYDELINELDHSLLQKVRQYCLWSYYNQTSNDIIELFFLKHEKVIPTLRKIPNIDFFIYLDGKIIPFDLKFTHISDSYFDLVSQGIALSNQGYDDYIITETSTSELKEARSYYMDFRKKNKEKNLVAASQLSKTELIDFIKGINTSDSKAFIRNLETKHEQFVPSTPEQLKTLEWWNYKYQGERLFCNNNRLFVFLSYKNQFIDGRELKGKTDEIGKLITKLLNTLTESSIHEIHYHYDKDDSLIGDYKAQSFSTIYSE